jgi:WXXGXW repeat (2 copies)
MVIKRFFGALLLGLILFAAYPSSTPAQIAVGISVHLGPPVLPVYAQPVCPAPGYIWTPGYWAYGPAGYYWVPGTWVIAPTPGFLWTPGYWGWAGGAYVWHGGYWGPHVGFYGGINYGFGYGGVGFVGGAWHGGVFAYNTAVTNVNTTVIHNTYVNNTVVNKTVINNNVSYNGGTGGVTAQPNAAELAAANEHHVEPTAMQTQHEEMARSDRSMLASENHGQPAVAATQKPGVFHGPGVVAAHPASANANHGNSFSSNNRNAQMQADRPPSARTNASTPAGNADRPNTTTQNHMQNPQGSHTNSNGNNGNQKHSSNTHTNNNHPNNSHSNENHPQPSHEHENNGHPGGHMGR